MDGEPARADLLAIAADTLNDSVAPVLSGAARYQALMVANAMRIAARELEMGDALAEARAACAAALTEGVAGLREGAHDADPALHESLRTLCAVATAITRPAALLPDERARAGLEGTDG